MYAALLLLSACVDGAIVLGPGKDTPADTGDTDTGGPADTDRPGDTDTDGLPDTDTDDTAATDTDDTADTTPLDADGDGAPAGTDCDDADPLVFPGAPEVCNGADDDCDALVDGQDADLAGATTWYRDADRDGLGDPADTLTQCDRPYGYVADGTDCDDADPAATCEDPPGDGTFHTLDLSDDVNRDHSYGPWTDDPSESFDVAPGTHAWTVADGTAVDFVVVDPDTNGGASLLLTHGGESWRPSYSFPTTFTIDGEGASGTRLHIAGLASGWSDPSLFTGVAATLTLTYTDGTEQIIELANGTNLDDWNHTWHSVSDTDAVRVYEDTTYGRHIDALTVALDSAAPIDTIVVRDDASVHTGTAEKTSVAIFALTVE